MPLGGGKWVVQNKLLPGAYVNFKSKPNITFVFADRGYGAIALPLDWGPEGEITTIDNTRLHEQSYRYLGHTFTDPALKPIRTIMLGAKVLHVYNLNSGGAKATTSLATGGLTVTARHPGIAGNKIGVSIENDVDIPDNYVITTYLEGLPLNVQSVPSLDKFRDNYFIDLTGTLSENALTAMTLLEGGENGTVKAGAHADFLTKVQGEYFNDIAYAGTDDQIRRLYEAFAKRMVDEIGYYIQCSVYHSTENHIAITSVEFDALNEDNIAAGVYWYLGQSAGTELGRNPAANLYNGEYELSFVTDRLEAEKAIKEGHLIMHKIDGQLRLLEDVNTFTNYSKEFTEDWSLNEVVRIAFQRAKDITTLFKKYYMQKVLNNADGRAMLWADCVYHAQDVLQGQLGVLEGYDPDDTTVTKGIQKGGVVIYDAIIPVTTMTKLYMTIEID